MRAAWHGRSVEAELREIVKQAVAAERTAGERLPPVQALADIHKADAATVPLDQAHAAFDYAAAELARAEAELPEEVMGEFDAADRAEAEPAGGGPAATGSAGGGPAARGEQPNLAEAIRRLVLPLGGIDNLEPFPPVLVRDPPDFDSPDFGR
jgi:plasmid stability protein